MATHQEAVEDAIQWGRLSACVPRWLSEVPLYRQAAAGGASPVGGLSPEAFARLPFVTKRDIRRDFPRNFLRGGANLEALLDEEKVELEHTAGTSDERTPLLLERGWWARQEERALRLNPLIAAGLDAAPQARRVTLTSPVCNNDICYTGRPSRNERIVGRALHVNLTRHPFLWSDAELARMAREAIEWAPQFLDVDPVYGALFAAYCERQGIRLPTLRFILSSYEFLGVTHRRCLERVFGVPVFNLYGSTETGHLLMENPEGDLVPSRETAFLEIVAPDDQGIGDLVVTTLTNDYMPLVRYRIGDLVARAAGSAGTTYVVHGRAAEAVRTVGGRRVTVHQVDACFAGTPGIIHYQLTEETPGDWALRVVGDEDCPTGQALDALRDRLASRLELSARPRLEWTDTLMPLPSGKFRLCQPQDQGSVR